LLIGTTTDNGMKSNSYMNPTATQLVGVEQATPSKSVVPESPPGDAAPAVAVPTIAKGVTTAPHKAIAPMALHNAENLIGETARYRPRMTHPQCLEDCCKVSVRGIDGNRLARAWETAYGMDRPTPSALTHHPTAVETGGPDARQIRSQQFTCGDQSGSRTGRV
jgi:hypothetical protein